MCFTTIALAFGVSNTKKGTSKGGAISRTLFLSRYYPGVYWAHDWTCCATSNKIAVFFLSTKREFPFLGIDDYMEKRLAFFIALRNDNIIFYQTS